MCGDDLIFEPSFSIAQDDVPREKQSWAAIGPSVLCTNSMTWIVSSGNSLSTDNRINLKKLGAVTGLKKFCFQGTKF